MISLDLITTQFHWLRPLWLLALIPAILLGISLWRQRRNAHQWQQVIAPELLTFLIDGETSRAHRWQIWAIITAWIIASFALAGPSWEKRPMPIQKNENALVLILDLSPSMLTEDIKPSRLIRARLKIADILRERKDGLTALIVYAGEAHIVTPLTDDTATINSLLTSLHPSIMPLPGSNTESAIDLALRLLTDAGIQRGDLLLLTDGVVEKAQRTIKSQLSNKTRLSILGVGSDEPAPIPSSKGGFLRDNNRDIITTQLASDGLKNLAQETGGRYSDITTDNRDIDSLLSLPSPLEEKNRKTEREFDSWYDAGHWLIFLLLPVLLYCFRRGVLVALLLVPALSFYSNDTMAMSWSDLWMTQDQQAQKTLNEGDANTAAEQFKKQDWKGSAQYRAGDYQGAAESFAQLDNAQAHYNRGNALAKAGKLDDAIKAYDEALKRDPQFTDAADNRKLLEELKKQQDQQQKDDPNNQDKKDQDQKDQDQKDQKNNGEDKQDQNQQDSDKNQSDQDKSDQSKSDKENQQDNDKQEGQNSSDANNQDQQQDSQQNSSESNKPENKNKSEQETEEQTKEQQEQEAAQQSSEPSDEEAKEMAAAMEEGNLSDEEKQSLEQWLRRVPDDPGGLLRNKFRYQYQQQREERHNNAWQTPQNADDERW